jgi:hypothetical protein
MDRWFRERVSGPPNSIGAANNAGRQTNRLETTQSRLKILTQDAVRCPDREKGTFQ